MISTTDAFCIYISLLVSFSFKGKAEAEKSVAQEFGDKSLIIKPAIVEGKKKLVV